MYELASPASFFHRVEPLLDAMKRLLHPVVALPKLRAPLVDQERRGSGQEEMCKDPNCQFSRLKAKKRVRYEPNATGSPYQDISYLKSNHSTTA